MRQREYAEGERRKYIRLDSVFPVEFRLLSPNGTTFLSDWLQGFTNNIGKGGMCLSVNNLKPALAKILASQQVILVLNIEMPLAGNPISAKARVSWVKEVAGEINKYLIGLSYEEINPQQNNRIMHYARAKKIFTPVVLSIISILFLGLALNIYVNIKLIRGNKALIDQLVKILQDSTSAKQQIKEISRERQDLQLKIQALQLGIQTVEEEKEKAKKEEARTTERMEGLNSQIEKLAQEKTSLQDQLITLQNKENTVTEQLLRLDQRKATLTQANFDKMHQWLTIHQNPRTGLVMSFEGDTEIADWAFIYDQALVAQAYTNFSDFERVKKILNFFEGRAKKKDKLFFNAYYVNDGSPAEYIVHSGPNIWLGIAIMQYTKKTQDKTYLPLALEIAQGIMDLQNKDAEGGIRGGPEINWYSTEHNLDAYAFFNMLYKTTTKAQYLDAANKVLSWLVKHTYDKIDLPIKRGKGDSTIATDTYAWSIAAIGPEKLEELGMNPDRIVEFAEQNCSVEVSFDRPEGQTVKVKGFDFAPQRHVARGGVVSSEWTAQMVLAFKIMADFYNRKDMVAKARAYEKKADEYLTGLSNMIISSPSPSGQGEGCLPYASCDFVDTGHGWMTPKGKYTGSLSGTTYALFAYYNYNPLEFN
jgi:outer membrane murein-binding lipoprotein Lpp